MTSLLSTRVLTTSQSEKLRQAGWNLQQYDAISIELRPSTFDPGSRLAIFTSRNAVRACFPDVMGSEFQGVKCLCVGEKTAGLLREKGIFPLEVAANAAELAGIIKNKYTEKSFIYYCGNKRLDLLPDFLDSSGVTWEEEVVYDTRLVRKNFHKSFDAVLFFSPSGVESYFEANPNSTGLALCIGSTTASEAKKYTDRFEIARFPSVQAVISLAEDQIRSVKP
jgi:uroporphyrinogen-III synthase